jgi:lysozyme
MISDQGLDLLTQRESKRNDAYLDSKGIPTIGVGHTGPEVYIGLHWTDEQVAEAFRTDLMWVTACIARVNDPLEQNQEDALYSFIFNIGGGAWASSTMLRLLNGGSPAGEVALQFDRWHTPPEITTRRNGEKFQFLGTVFAARCDNEGNPVT